LQKLQPIEVEYSTNNTPKSTASEALCSTVSEHGMNAMKN